MIDIECPWCETRLELPQEPLVDRQTCPECLTSWSYEPAPEHELAAAA